MKVCFWSRRLNIVRNVNSISSRYCGIPRGVAGGTGGGKTTVCWWSAMSDSFKVLHAVYCFSESQSESGLLPSKDFPNTRNLSWYIGVFYCRCSLEAASRCLLADVHSWVHLISMKNGFRILTVEKCCRSVCSPGFPGGSLQVRSPQSPSGLWSGGNKQQEGGDVWFRSKCGWGGWGYIGGGWGRVHLSTRSVIVGSSALRTEDRWWCLDDKLSGRFSDWPDQQKKSRTFLLSTFKTPQINLIQTNAGQFWMLVQDLKTLKTISLQLLFNNSRQKIQQSYYFLWLK